MDSPETTRWWILQAPAEPLRSEFRGPRGARGWRGADKSRGAIAKGAIGPRGAKATLEGRREKAWGHNPGIA